MKREAYQAAAARARYVVDHYPKTPSIPYALQMMVVAYDLLELPDLSNNARKVLLLNYPDFRDSNLSIFTEFNKKGGLSNRLFYSR